ncbi:comF family protein [Fontimonas thermophila]|uniref:ComF family protein n=2 Tax=Fontimonas thermophila TaxID=1076937 RepID=A0A1I2K0D0_9GAMM|nr:comF family protein [Fontimonas thermophila]
MVGRALAALLPPRCRRCHTPLRGGMLCPPCSAELPWNHTACTRCAQPLAVATVCSGCQAQPPPFDQAWAALRLEPPVQHWIHALKYRADLAQAPLLGTLMCAQLARRAAPLPQLLLPVPLHAIRLRRRGYNQALEISRVLAHGLSIPLAIRAAERIRPTEDQIGQSAAARRRNMRDAFAINGRLDGLHVALVDDVMTTGATFASLARACRAAGAVRIEVWAAARTP